jgi:methylglyoxal reductase
MLDRDIERSCVPICRRQRVSILSYSSLALGLLTGRIGPERCSRATTCASTIRASASRTARAWPVLPRRSNRSPKARRERRATGHRLDDRAARDNLRALRRAQCEQARENARRRNPAALGASELAAIDAAAARHLSGIHA